MAGILANSVSATMVSGDTAADKSVTGYLRNERVTLGVTPTGSAYAWTLSAPAGSSAAKCALTDDDVAAPVFVPDVAGTYVITCTVDATTSYAMRLTVLNVAAADVIEAIRLTPRTDAQVTAPSVGVVLYYSSTQSSLAIKTSAGVVRTVTTVAV